jgi:hypothetical protein
MNGRRRRLPLEAGSSVGYTVRCADIYPTRGAPNARGAQCLLSAASHQAHARHPRMAPGNDRAPRSHDGSDGRTDDPPPRGAVDRPATSLHREDQCPRDPRGRARGGDSSRRTRPHRARAGPDRGRLPVATTGGGGGARSRSTRRVIGSAAHPPIAIEPRRRRRHPHKRAGARRSPIRAGPHHPRHRRDRDERQDDHGPTARSHRARRGEQRGLFLDRRRVPRRPLGEGR